MESKWPAGFRALLIVAAIAAFLLVGRAWAATEAAGDSSSSDGTTDVQAPADDGGAKKSKEAEKPRRPWQQRRRLWPGPRVPEGVKAFGDLEYAKVGERPLLLDLYVPEKAEGPLPLVVWVHGGGWRAGNKRFCRALPMTKRGYVVASIGYRLSGESPMPAQIHDCKAAVRWLRANAGEYNIDPKRIGAWGSSAGGHLVALMGTSGDVKDLEGDLGNADQSSRLQAVCDFFGPSDLISIFEQLGIDAERFKKTTGGPVLQLLGGTINEKRELARAASPVTHVTKDDPPFLIVHGDADLVVPYTQSVKLHEALKKAVVDSTLRTVKGAGHGFRNAGPAERAAIDRAVNEFFDKHLKSAKTTDKQAKSVQEENQGSKKKKAAVPAQ